MVTRFTKLLALLFVLFVFAVFGFGQTATTATLPTAPVVLSTSTVTGLAPLPSNAIFLGVGASTGKPAGSFAYLHLMGGSTYGFARYDIVGIDKRTHAIATVATVGICDVILQAGPFFLGGCVDGGTAISNVNVGGAGGADGLAGFRFGKNKNIAFAAMGGVLKTSLSTVITPLRAGFVYGWGK